MVEQLSKQRVSQQIVSSNGYLSYERHPLQWNASSQPLSVPPHGQRATTQIAHEPGGQQQVDPLAIGNCADKDEQCDGQPSALKHAYTPLVKAGGLDRKSVVAGRRGSVSEDTG